MRPNVGDLRTTFLRAWAELDEGASRVADRRGRGTTAATLERQAIAMERAAGDYGATLGLTSTTFRSVLDAWRRAGWSRVEALRAVECAVEDRKRA